MFQTTAVQPQTRAQDQTQDVVSEDELFQVFQRIPQEQIEKIDEVVKQMLTEKTKEDGETTNSREDNDSAYETSSPNSSFSYSPMPNSRFSDAENSPYHDSDSSLYSSSPDNEVNLLNNNQKTFKVPSLNIPVKTVNNFNKQPSEIHKKSSSRSLPSSPVQQRHHFNIAPQCAIVQEAEMIKPAVKRIISFLDRKLLDIEWIRVLQDDFFYQEINLKNET